MSLPLLFLLVTSTEGREYFSIKNVFCLAGQIGNTESELKKLAEENPDLQEAYIAKQKRLKVSEQAIVK